jgi:predicted RNase H-like nuclease (RuvC/YqgF family)
LYLIVGLDAGIKTGYVILNLDGGIIASGVEKEASHERIVKIISDVGTPSLIATDVSRPPHFVQKVAARFHARVFHPQKSITVEEKKSLGKKIVDPHIRDAYSAAVKAYRHYANRFRQVDRMKASKKEKDKLKHLLIRGKAIGKEKK